MQEVCRRLLAGFEEGERGAVGGARLMARRWGSGGKGETGALGPVAEWVVVRSPVGGEHESGRKCLRSATG